MEEPLLWKKETAKVMLEFIFVSFYIDFLITWLQLKNLNAMSKQNRNFRRKGGGRSGRRPLLPKIKLNILVDLTLGKSYHSVVTFCMLRKLSAIRSQSRPHRN